ncbi:DUF6361 family protein [bacterium]|nr:DUF6361 family protein [bacterium]
MSGIGWVDFSSEHRDKVKLVIDRLSTPGVIDELGIGVIRNSFSDSLFPGISTIQTRAKYFLTVPRIFKDYEKLQPSKRRRKDLSSYLNEQENSCMKAMVSNYDSEATHQIIGASFFNKPGEVLRKPSSVYWAGIRIFGLIDTDLSLQQFCNKFANPDQPLKDLIEGNEKTKGDDADADAETGVGIRTPAYDDDWIESLDVAMSYDEAEFLTRQIEARVPTSLIGQILLAPEVRAQFLDLPSDSNFTAFADEASFLKQFPSELQQVVFAARDFWQLMHGAHIRYNCQLQSAHGTSEKEAEFENLWEQWLRDLKHFNWERWDTGFLWKLADDHHRSVHDESMAFVTDWIEEVRVGRRIEELDRLVFQQEKYNKKGRARLLPGADESVNDWIGIDDLNYRLGNARTIINDIHVGLTNEGVDAER